MKRWGDKRSVSLQDPKGVFVSGDAQLEGISGTSYVFSNAAVSVLFLLMLLVLNILVLISLMLT